MLLRALKKYTSWPRQDSRICATVCQFDLSHFFKEANKGIHVVSAALEEFASTFTLTNVFTFTITSGFPNIGDFNDILFPWAV